MYIRGNRFKKGRRNGDKRRREVSRVRLNSGPLGYRAKAVPIVLSHFFSQIVLISVIAYMQTGYESNLPSICAINKCQYKYETKLY